MIIPVRPRWTLVSGNHRINGLPSALCGYLNLLTLRVRFDRMSHRTGSSQPVNGLNSRQHGGVLPAIHYGNRNSGETKTTMTGCWSRFFILQPVR